MMKAIHPHFQIAMMRSNLLLVFNIKGRAGYIKTRINFEADNILHRLSLKTYKLKSKSPRDE
jgi:hypothetical protein